MRKFDWKIAAKFVGIITIVLTSLVGGAKWSVAKIEEYSDLKADKKYRIQYDSLLTDYITLRIQHDMEHGH